MNKKYYIIEIINLLNTVRNEEDYFNEGFLTDDIFIAIIQLLVDLYRCDK